MRNILSNLGWLVGGKGLGAVCSIIYLAVLARSLGIKDFGHFSLIFGTGQALVALAGFQTWQTVVRYGAGPIHAGDHESFGRLSLMCGLIDALGAASGCVLAAIIYYGFADELGLNPDFVNMTFAFNCALLWARTTAAAGILRVLDRFDISVFVEAIVPISRLLAAFAIWATGPSVLAFLIAWAAIDLITSAIYWIAAWRLAPDALRLSHFGQFRKTIDTYPGILRFLGITYAGSSMDALFKQGPLLAVGFFLSTSAAGIYRLADQLAQGLSKLSALLARALYSEIANANVAETRKHFKRLVARVSIMASLGGLIILLIAAIGGRQILDLIGGDAFSAGHTVLIPLALGCSLELASIAYEPVLHATGRAILSLFSRLCAIAIGITAGFFLLQYGSPGIAWSVAVGYLGGFIVITAITWRVLSGDHVEDGDSTPQTDSI
ncbi:lipopolysaccharide biosynthesis protein [Altericroceibacterium endophyticum]|uniref:lipopolysaccharide biosynthesis protein n=1 Tax=Altericroceibacterium endophyticum TaxID=1808508 RepID=UPI001EEE71A0|nr:oligosaccharide flippase family protein [Altericroceibacterium endophyticum]